MRDEALDVAPSTAGEDGAVGASDHAPRRDGGSRRAALAELLALACAHQAAVHRAAAAGVRDADAVTAAERVAALSREELWRRTAPPEADPRVYLAEAAAVPEASRATVPRSGHVFLVGRLVTGMKRATVSVLRSGGVGLPDEQRTFNATAVRALSAVVAARRGRAPGWERDAAVAAARLAREADAWATPDADAPSSPGVQGALARAHVLVAPVIERQRRWNATAVEATRLAASADAPPLPRVHALTAAMWRTGRPTAAHGLPALSQRTRPLWAELFRPQEAFNVAFETALAAVFGMPRPPVDGGVERYALWLAAEEPRWAADAALALARLAQRPLISIVVPVYDTPPALLRACLDSVLAQTYDRWELCAVDDGSPGDRAWRVLDDYARRDPRIRVERLAVNRGIAGATNVAIGLASGDWVGFLDHDDTLAPFALAAVAAELDRAPETDVVYCDEDHVDEQGRRVRPFCKPAWSPELLRSANYVCHYLVVRRTLLETLGRVRPGFDGAQDFDLVLRLAEQTDRVRHIPRILYHWRASPTSTALDLSNKPTASGAGVRALRDHLARCGERGTVDDPEPTRYRVRGRAVGTPTASIVVAVPPGGDADPARLQAVLHATRYPHHDGRLVRAGDDGMAAAWNRGIEESRGEFVALLHADVVVEQPQWLEELLALAERPGVGAVGARLVYPDRAIAHAGFVVTPDGRVHSPFEHMVDVGQWTAGGNPQWVRTCLAVSGACLVVRREHLARVGGFDERFAAFADVDLCLRLRALGLRAVSTPHVTLVHQGCTVSPRPEERERLAAAMRSVAPDGDPYWNPNLDAAAGDGRLRDVWTARASAGDQGGAR